MSHGQPNGASLHDAWWALAGLEHDGITPLPSTATNMALRVGGFAQPKYADRLAKDVKAGGLGVAGVARFRTEGLAGFTEAVRAMLAGDFDPKSDDDEDEVEVIAPTTAAASAVAAASASGAGVPPQAHAAVAGSAAPTPAGADLQ